MSFALNYTFLVKAAQSPTYSLSFYRAVAVLCRMIHCGQRSLSLDVSVGRTAEALLINGGERKQHNED